MKLFVTLAGASLVCLVLSACAHNPALVEGPGLKVAESSELPAPTVGDTTGSEGPYRIGPYDTLSIQVYNLPKLSNDKIQVDAGGGIAIPLVGSLEAAGRTPAELSAQITSSLRAAGVRKPDVAVNMIEISSQIVTVTGAVREPGNYPVQPEMTLMRAVAAAKGSTELTDFKHVVVFRNVDGQRMAALYNVNSIQRGVYDDPRIYPNDVVVVGESASREVLRIVGQLAPAIVTPLVYLFTR
ncbi:polysaccharide biosynthesis/export family protein [Croceibacterium aestuarii]|uniref:polysaccharide biosynthesis/export family protein n=1 Tax=Croceibacterium aestuarii TaxID=3064139 RepID=UPI00272E01CA|nr:polysaccharide biosynthesis/export family protein [Croceibacterium sp. D39]